MICNKFKQIVLPQSSLHNNINFYYLLTSRIILKKCFSIDCLLGCITSKEISNMSQLKIILRDLRVWSAWTRSNIVTSVVKRCRKDRGVREVIQCFRQAFFRPKRTLLISATAAYKAKGDDDETNPPCKNSITDADLEELLKDLDAVEMLSRNTLFCAQCGKRLVIDKKQPGVPYCSCKVTEAPKLSDNGQSDGWVPYMEAEDVIIWRKEYKPGFGLYAYKVYGRYPDVRAADFAAVQMDSSYRREWDAAVAALTVVEEEANGLPDQAVLHWEVLWPRLFANRDYVYIRRHKEYDAKNKGLPHREGLFHPTESAEKTEKRTEPIYSERPSVHSNARRKAMEAYAKEKDGENVDNKVYVIISRSCEHPDVPESKNAIRVYEYWSHMVVKTMNGTDKSGMEFVLTYYDEPAVGGMPSSVASWATGRAAPAYLQRMRRAALEYQAWRQATQPELTEITPFVSEPTVTEQEKPTEVKLADEQDKESSQLGLEQETKDSTTRDQGTQTEEAENKSIQVTEKATEDKSVETDNEEICEPPPAECECLKTLDEEDTKTNGGWWRYLIIRTVQKIVREKDVDAVYTRPKNVKM